MAQNAHRDPSPLEKKIHMIRTEMKHYQQDVKYDVNQLKQYLDPAYLWDRTKYFARTQLTKPSVLLTIGGIVVGVIVIKSLFGSGDDDEPRPSDRRIPDRKPVVVREAKQPGLLGTLVRTAMQTFILHYTRKLLIRYLDRTNGNGHHGKTESTAAASSFS